MGMCFCPVKTNVSIQLFSNSRVFPNADCLTLDKAVECN